MNLRLDRKPSVTISWMGGIPALPEPFVWSLARLIQHTQEASDLVVHLDRPTVSYHSYARDVLAGRMQGDWLLQLDTDHEFDPDLLLRLLNSAQQVGAKVISGLYCSKNPPHHPIAYLFPGDKPGVGVPVGVEATHPLFQVDATGGGALLVHRSVFDRITRELGETPFDPVTPPGAAKPMGEDLSFGYRCKKLGIPVWLDTRVKVKHLRWHGTDADEFEQYRHRCVLKEVQVPGAAA